MRRIIPPKTKRSSTLYKDFTYKDLIVCLICLIIAAISVSSNIGWPKWVITVISMLAALCLCLPYGHYYRGYDWLHIIRGYLFQRKKYSLVQMAEYIKHKNEEGTVEIGGMYVALLEVAPVEFLLYKESKQQQIILQFAAAVRELRAGSIIKIEKPVDYEAYIQRYKNELKIVSKEMEEYLCAEKDKAKKSHKAFDATQVDLSMFKSRIDLLEQNIVFIEYVHTQHKINAETFYLAIYEQTKERLEKAVSDEISRLSQIGLAPRRISSEEIDNVMQLFVYKQPLSQGTQFTMPAVKVCKNCLWLNDEKWHIASIGNFPVFADGNHWASSLFTIPKTNMVINFGLANREQVTKSINKTIKEIRFRFTSEKDASGQQNLQIQHEALKVMLQQFQLGNESVHNANFYIMYQDEQENEVRQIFDGQGFARNKLRYVQFDGFVSMLPIFPAEMLASCCRQMQSTTLAAAFPFINNLFMDAKGDYLGDFRYPVFFDMWERAPQNRNRLNSNLCIIGQSGSGKTFLQKKLLMQQRVHGTRIFVLDCEGEYSHEAEKLGGQTIEMSGGSRLNPFQIFSSFDNDEDLMSLNYKTPIVGDVSAQCAFLSEWFKSILSMDINCKAMLDNSIAEMYQTAKISDASDLSKVKAKDWPTFDTLMKIISDKKNKKGISAYDFETLQKLENYLSLFTGNGIYSRLWNGATTLKLERDFIVFDFQNLFANANTEVCNAQMQLLMRLLMKEVIKVRNENEATGSVKRLIVLIDEAHRYISSRYPVALDTMEQFARRIRKYDGALIVATQNIKDFIGTSDEMRTKASAVINNCQYSMLFGLKPDDLNDVQKLYANYGGGLTPEELNFLGTAELGQMLFLVEPEKRSVVKVGLIGNEKTYMLRDAA